MAGATFFRTLRSLMATLFGRSRIEKLLCTTVILATGHSFDPRLPKLPNPLRGSRKGWALDVPARFVRRFKARSPCGSISQALTSQ